MSIEVVLYGKLSKKVPQRNEDTDSPQTLYISDKIDSVFDILRKLYIEENEISHIFVNGKYCGPGKKIKEGDHIGIFPKNMGLMFVEIAKNNTIFITVKFFANLQKYGPEKSIIELPEGSTINSILKKYRIPKEKQNLIILVNRIPKRNYYHILEDGDVVALFPPLAGG